MAAWAFIFLPQEAQSSFELAGRSTFQLAFCPDLPYITSMQITALSLRLTLLLPGRSGSVEAK